MRGDAFLKMISGKPPFSMMHPKVASFFKDYLSQEKVICFQGRYIINTHFPPYPSPAFDNLVSHFNWIGSSNTQQLYSVTLAVTNRCHYRCRHCYNSGRDQTDMPLEILKKLVLDLQNLGAVQVSISGGEPMLRADLENITAAFDGRTCLTLNTSGDGFSAQRARSLQANGLFGAGISLDSADPVRHDRFRGKKGAYNTAIQALGYAAEAGLYPYVIAVATREFLEPVHFSKYIQRVKSAGALEIHLLEPASTGKLAGNSDVVLKPMERQRLFDYQKEMADDDSLPILSTFAYLESPEAFGCGAGVTHLYIDGSGEVCPCNLVPLSFGNVIQEPLDLILDRMRGYFREPRTACLGSRLANYITGNTFPAKLQESIAICESHLPKHHETPAFFRIRSESLAKTGTPELKSAYNRIHSFYDIYWLSKASKPVDNLVRMLPVTGVERVLEAGCGTGFATALLASTLKNAREIITIDISEGMIEDARQRFLPDLPVNIRFVCANALDIMAREEYLDLIFSSWVLGYIPLEPFFNLSSQILKQGGRLAFIVHRENSPREPLELFAEIVLEDPSLLMRQVDFEFPRGSHHLETLLTPLGFKIDHNQEDAVIFRYDTPYEVLEHLLKSGAGTAFHDAIDPKRITGLEQTFLRRFERYRKSSGQFEIIHEYVMCIAVKI